MIRSWTTKLLATAVVVGALAVMLPAAPASAASKAAAVRGHSPPSLYNTTMAYDAADGQVVLFGGKGIVTGILRSTWTWDGTMWTQRHPAHSPPARMDASMAYDAADGQVVLFGGYGNDRTRSDTWTWDGTDWTRRYPVHSPSPRRRMAMAYDATNAQVVLFGGETIGSGAFANDTWTWNGTDWTQQSPSHSPDGRWYPGVAYDPVTVSVLMFGGVDAQLHALGDTWSWNGSDWTQLSPVHAPSPRSDLGMTQDSTEGYDLLYGGFDGHQSLGDTWSWNGSDWTQLSPQHSALPLNDQAMADDPATGQAVLFGGYQYFGAPADSATWTWDGSDWTKHPSGWIGLSPRSGPAGSAVEVTGWGFVAFESITLRFVDSNNGRTVLKRVRTDIDGRFTSGITIPPTATVGTQKVKATGIVGHVVTRRHFTVT